MKIEEDLDKLTEESLEHSVGELMEEKFLILSEI